MTIHYISPTGIGGPWVATEMSHMLAKGIPCRLTGLRSPDQMVFGADWAHDILERSHRIYPLRWGVFLRDVLLAPFRYRGRFIAAVMNGLTGERESFRGRLAALWHLLVACHWVRHLEEKGVSLIHVHWVHSAGTVGMYAGWLLGKPFSFTGHAADLFRDRVALRDKIRRAEFIICISDFHRRFYIEEGASPEKLKIVYCGLDVDEIKPVERTRGPGRPRILSFGRLCEKKGFDDLILACSMLRERGVDCECVIEGEGELADELKEQVEDLGLEDRVTVTGKVLLQEDITAWMADGDVFAQPCVQAADGDMDGTPRSLMEAMLCELPSVSTYLAGIPEIIEDGVSGLLVEPRDVEGLADAIERLLKDRELASRLGIAGRKRILDVFRLPQCLDGLVATFGEYVELSADDGHGRSPQCQQEGESGAHADVASETPPISATKA